MSKIEKMIGEAIRWRDFHHRVRPIEATAAALRAHALIDAYEAVGGDGSRWRKECGVLKP